MTRAHAPDRPPRLPSSSALAPHPARPAAWGGPGFAVPSPAQMLGLQRTMGNRAVGRLLAAAGERVHRKFYEYVPARTEHVWHAEDPSPEFIPVGRKHSALFDLNSWDVYVRKANSPFVPDFARRMLKAVYKGYTFELGSIQTQSHEEWTKELEERGEPDTGDPSYSGYTAGSSKPPAQRSIRLHRDRLKVDTLIHELVHLNAVEDFESTIGKVLNEGITELLAQNAMKKTGFVPTGHYTDVVPIAQKLAARIGIDALAKAWFSTGSVGLDNSLRDKGVDLVELCEATGHTYVRLSEIRMGSLEDLGLSLGTLVVSGNSGGSEDEKKE